MCRLSSSSCPTEDQSVGSGVPQPPLQASSKMPILKSSVFLLLLFLNPLQGSTLGLRNGPATSSLPEKCAADKFFNLETGQCSSCAPELIPSPEGEWGIDGGLGQGKGECTSRQQNCRLGIIWAKELALGKIPPTSLL